MPISYWSEEADCRDLSPERAAAIVRATPQVRVPDAFSWSSVTWPDHFTGRRIWFYYGDTPAKKYVTEGKGLIRIASYRRQIRMFEYPIVSVRYWRARVRAPAGVANGFNFFRLRHFTPTGGYTCALKARHDYEMYTLPEFLQEDYNFFVSRFLKLKYRGRVL